MNACDVVGYTYNADTYCPNCMADIAAAEGFDPDGEEAVEYECNPIFGDSETDCPSHCAVCGEYIPESLTAYGVRYVLKTLWRELHPQHRPIIQLSWLAPQTRISAVWRDELDYGYLSPFARGVLAKHRKMFG